MKNNSRLITLLFLVSVTSTLVACKKGTPEISNLKSLSGFSLDQSQVNTNSKTLPAFSISGICDSKYSDIQVSNDSGSNWYSVSKVSTSSTINCKSTGKFSAALAFSAGFFSAAKWSSTGTYSTFRVRGFSSLGYSDAVTLTLTNSGSRVGAITVGGSNTPLTGTGFILKGELGSVDTQPAMAGGSYKLQGEVVW